MITRHKPLDRFRSRALRQSALWLLLLLTLTACSHVVRSTGDQQVDIMLRAMGQASTWGHPDEAGQYAGMRAYAQGNYAEAMRQFRQAARYADKMSQLALGLMYLNGHGVKADPVMAFAWVAIAAERDYPQFLATRDRIWTGLDAQQRKQARAEVDRLYAEYGDKVAKPRMARELDYWRTRITGSMLGFDSGVHTLNAGSGNCSGAVLDSGVAVPGCNVGVYADWRMNPDLYFRVKDAQWKGQVVVGRLQDLHKGTDDGPDDKPAEKTRANSSP